MRDIIRLQWVVLVAISVALLGVFVYGEGKLSDLENGYKHVSLEVQQRDNVFSRVPTDKLHTMRVWEDGSYEVEYVDGTSEVGCLPTGLCKD